MTDQQLELFSVESDPGSAWLDQHLKELQHQFQLKAPPKVMHSMQEVMMRYDVVEADAHGRYMIVAERGTGVNPMTSSDAGFFLAERNPGITREQAIRELGYSSPSPWTSWTREEWNPKLFGLQGLTQYYQMKRQDGTVRGTLRQLKTPIQAAHWFVEPASDSTIDVNIAKWVSDQLFEGLNVSWSKVLDDILLMCEYGHMVFEKVWGVDPSSGRIVLKKLAPRHPMDVQDWLYDRNGGPDGVRMMPNDFDGEPNGVFIPISKLVIFSMEAEAGDLRGTSILRSAFKHWYFKDTLYKIDAIQKERHGIGVPIIKLPPGWSPSDRATADEIGRNLRTNERAHVVLPPFWELLFAKLEGQPVDCIASIEHHDAQIYANILAMFAKASKSDRDSQDMFYKSTRYIANGIVDTLNRHLIKQMVDLNFQRGKYPKLRARRIGEWEDIRVMSFSLRNFVGAGLITPDERLEEQLRKELDLPPADISTRRQVATPQNGGVQPPEPGRAGPPRQSKTPPVGTPSGNAGRDGGGTGGGGRK